MRSKKISSAKIEPKINDLTEIAGIAYLLNRTITELSGGH